MAGRRKNKAYGELDYELIKVNNKHAAYCNVCQKIIHNTAEARLRTHRRCCPKNNNSYDDAGNLLEKPILEPTDVNQSFLKQEDPFKTNNEAKVNSGTSNYSQNQEWRTFRVGGRTNNKRSTVSTENQMEDSDNDEYVQAVAKKRHTSCDNDDVDFFFKSIAMSVKKLRPDLINDAKIQTLQMIFSLESKNKQPPSTFANNVESILGQHEFKTHSNFP